MLKRFLRSRFVTVVASAVAASYLELAFRTTRWQLDAAPADIHLLDTEPVILAFWHERLLLMPVLWRLVRRAARSGRRGPGADVLISRHHDGILIARTVRWFGARAVHGSSASRKQGRVTERGGAAAIRRLAASLASGRHVLVTPDGPRGPAHAAKSGLLQLARLSGRPILPAAASIAPHARLPSWDRMMVPLPFGRGRLVVGPAVPLDLSSRDRSMALLEAALDDALRRCGGA